MKIKVIIKRPDSRPYSANISTTLQNLQSIVGGYIETLAITKDMVMIMNQEGTWNQTFNFRMFNIDFFGTVIFAGVNGEEFVDVPMTFADFKVCFGSLFEEENK